jgi:hypothetical protein
VKRWRWLLSAALAASTISNIATVQADEESRNDEPVPIDEIPAPAREALLTGAGGGEILEVVQGTRHGQWMYEASVRQGKRVVTIDVDAAGHLLAPE